MCCVGHILKFFCKLKNDDDQAHAASEIETAAVEFCVNATSATPLTMPVKLTRDETLDSANQYEVGFLSSSSPQAQPTKPGKPKPRRPTDWPIHMFYAFDTQHGRWRAAVHAVLWYGGEAGARAGSAFVARKKNTKKIVFCGQIVPVDISKYGHLVASERELHVPDEVDIAVKRLSFMCFGIATQKY